MLVVCVAYVVCVCCVRFVCVCSLCGVCVCGLCGMFVVFAACVWCICGCDVCGVCVGSVCVARVLCVVCLWYVWCLCGVWGGVCVRAHMCGVFNASNTHPTQLPPKATQVFSLLPTRIHGCTSLKRPPRLSRGPPSRARAAERVGAVLGWEGARRREAAQ